MWENDNNFSNKQIATMMAYDMILVDSANVTQNGLYPVRGIEYEEGYYLLEESSNELYDGRPKFPEEEKTEDENSPETRSIIHISCSVKMIDKEKHLTLLLRFDDEMNRHLTCKVSENETSDDLAAELVKYGLINKADQEQVSNKIQENLHPTS